MTSPNKYAAELKAREIIKTLYIEDVSDLDIESIAMARGAFVKYDRLVGAEARLSSIGNKGLITVSTDIQGLGRKRFAIAHELGHFELHRKKTPAFSCSEGDFIAWFKTKPLEVEANHFAAELLMPENLFKKKVCSADLSIELLQDLKEEFQTSLTATSIRFVQFRPEYALVVSENGKIKWFVITDEFPYYLHLRGNLHPASIAYDFFQGRDLSSEFVEISPEAWIDDFRFKGAATVKELAFGISHYNQVLSFIHIEKHEDEDEYCRELDGYPKFR
jgi:Zn-dependent peptidase ImmA (M78 family)